MHQHTFASKPATWRLTTLLLTGLLAVACGGGPIVDPPIENPNVPATPGDPNPPVTPGDPNPPVTPADPVTPGDPTPPPDGPPGGPPPVSPIVTTKANVAMDVIPQIGTLYPCEWDSSNTYCYRWVNFNAPVWLWTAISFDENFAYVWEQMWNTGAPWTEQVAISRSDQTVWYVSATGWIQYDPIGHVIDDHSATIGTPDACGGGALCEAGMLNPLNTLGNGVSVPEFLRQLATGT